MTLNTVHRSRLLTWPSIRWLSPYANRTRLSPALYNNQIIYKCDYNCGYFYIWWIISGNRIRQPLPLSTPIHPSLVTSKLPSYSPTTHSQPPRWPPLLSSNPLQSKYYSPHLSASIAHLPKNGQNLYLSQRHMATIQNDLLISQPTENCFTLTHIGSVWAICVKHFAEKLISPSQ